MTLEIYKGSTISGTLKARLRVPSVARQQHGATVSPVAWGQARSISDDVVMMAAGAGGVKWDGVVAVVER